MSKPPEHAANFLKNLRSIYVGHLGLQSVTYRVETPCNMSNWLVYKLAEPLHNFYLCYKNNISEF
jgi:hypothetical protein